ncbi:MAG: T9SS type A sorting domain-containing protein [Bacteroidales bacterium]|nr:T9SS type A sorting domain-containing protein [Bacteroidales bacterium]
MKKLFKFLCVAVFTTFTLSAVAQEVNMDNKIVLYQHYYSFNDGYTDASFSLAPYNNNTYVMIQRGDVKETFLLEDEDYPTNFDDYGFLEGCDSIVIYGDVSIIEIYSYQNSSGYQREEIEKIKIDASTLTNVSIQDMDFMTFDFVCCPQLRGVYIYNTRVSRNSLGLLPNFPIRYLTFDQTNITASHVIDIIKDKDLLQTLRFTRNRNSTTAGYDSIMCALNDRNAETQVGTFYSLYNTSDTNSAKFSETNTSNAQSKNWQIKYVLGSAEVPAGIGTYNCSSSLEEITSDDATLTIYPNPATNEIVINNVANNGLVEIFDITGKLVKQVVYNNKVDVSNLLTGVYTIKVNNKTQKLVIE